MTENSSNRPTEGARLPPQTAERWRQIVQRAVRNGTDISQLVQHFAERAFDNKTVNLDAQGAKRRALTQMRLTLSREIKRAQKALDEHKASKRPTMLRAYEGISLTFMPPARAGKNAKKVNAARVVPLALDGDTHASKSSPLAEKLTTAQALQSYIVNLTVQGQAIDKEMSEIDALLNRGMQNRDSTVAELSATTQELWRLAQLEVQAASQGTKESTTRDAQTGEPHEPLPEPLSEEKTEASPTLPQTSAQPSEAPLTTALQRGQAILQNVQSLFKKKS